MEVDYPLSITPLAFAHLQQNPPPQRNVWFTVWEWRIQVGVRWVQVGGVFSGREGSKGATDVRGRT